MSSNLGRQISASSLGSLDGKVTIVTGAASGIGRSAAEIFAEAGARLVIVDRDETGLTYLTEQLKTAGSEVLPVACDISSEDEVQRMVATAVDHFGRLDCAFNNAGVDADPTALADVTKDEWRRILDVNLTGTFHCVQQEIRAMLSTGGGAIVNMSSGLALVAVPNLGPYTVSKHGILGLTRTAALEYAKQGIRVNALCPGIISTPMAQRTMSSGPEVEEALASFQPIGRLGRPDEVAAVALFLLSDAASFITGVLRSRWTAVTWRTNRDRPKVSPVDAGADITVVGAGAAGCVIARRLHDAGASVLLPEAAGDPIGERVFAPSRSPKLSTERMTGHCVEIFRRIEAFDRGANEYRGAGGPVSLISRFERGPSTARSWPDLTIGQYHRFPRSQSESVRPIF